MRGLILILLHMGEAQFALLIYGIRSFKIVPRISVCNLAHCGVAICDWFNIPGPFSRSEKAAAREERVGDRRSPSRVDARVFVLIHIFVLIHASGARSFQDGGGTTLTHRDSLFIVIRTFVCFRKKICFYVRITILQTQYCHTRPWQYGNLGPGSRIAWTQIRFMCIYFPFLKQSIIYYTLPS